MSPGQKFKYFMPAWNRCCKLNGWHTRDKAAVVDTAALTAEGRQMWALARQRALSREDSAGRPTLDDMRHACYIVAIKKDKETDALTNDEQDRIVALFNLLADPLDLEAMQIWTAYQRGENPGNKKRRKWFMKSRAPEGVLRHITQDLTGGQTKDFESLDDQKEAELCRLLAQRPVYSGAPKSPRSKRTYVLNPHKKFETANLPF